MKEGLFQDRENRESLLELARFASTHDAEQQTTLQEYVQRMKPGQDAIYYLSGDSRKKIEASPHLEAFREKGYEVLILTDPVDEVWTQSVSEFGGKKLQSAGKGAVALGTEEEKKQAEEAREKKQQEFGSLLECLKNRLREYVKEVRLSNRLTTSPACLVSDTHDMSPQLEQMIKAMGQELPVVKRILEVNPAHPVLAKLQVMFDANKDDPALGDYAELLYGQAVLAEGGQLPNPGQFSKLVADLMIKGM